MTQSHGGALCVAFIIHVKTLRRLTACPEHIWYTGCIKENSAPDPTQSQSQSYAHDQHVNQNLENLRWRRSALSHWLQLVLVCCVTSVYKSDLHLRGSHQGPSREQVHSSTTLCIYSSAFFHLCVCVRFSLKTHTCKCVSPSYHCFPFPILNRYAVDGKDTYHWKELKHMQVSAALLPFLFSFLRSLYCPPTGSPAFVRFGHELARD